MSEHVLIVGTGRDFPARIRHVRPGAQTSVICQLDSIGKVRGPGEHVRVIGVRNDASDQEWIDLAAAVHAHHPFTRIATFGEKDQNRYAAIAQALGLRAHSPATMALVHDKAAMRTRLREAGIDSTACARVADLDELRAFVRRHGSPCIIKPVTGSGSAGVTKVMDESDLAQAFKRAGGSYLGLLNPGVLVEEFLDGPQFSVEAVTELGEHQIVAITRKYSEPETFVELGHVSPAELSGPQCQEIHAYVQRVLDALGVEFGPTHTEIVLGADGPRLIETHLRMGGDHIPTLTLEATGVDLDDCAVRQTLGEKVLPGIRATLAQARPDRFAAIWFASLGGLGVLDGVSGLDEARAIPGVTEAAMLARAGAQVGALETSESRVAFARAIGQTAAEALTAARQAVTRLEFHLRVRSREGATV